MSPPMNGGGATSSSGGNSIIGGSGMSRAAKKRAKKKQKVSATPTSTSTEDDEQGSGDPVNVSQSSSPTKRANDDKQEVPNEAAALPVSFDKKKIKSIIKDVSFKMGVGGIGSDDDDDDDGTVKETKIQRASEKTLSKAAVPVEEIPELPPNISLASILSIPESSSCSSSDGRHHGNSDLVEQKQQQLESLTAKQRGACLLQVLLGPTITVQDFYQTYWEKKPLLVKASNTNRKRFANLLSLQGIREMTKQHPMHYGKDLNVTKYQKAADGVKRRITLDKQSTHDKSSRAAAAAAVVDISELWSNYDSGCTIRLLCPHKHNHAVQALLSNLETEFQCMVGANAYLTPPQSAQGFAPHYDDIEAFCLQLEGSKRWKVYHPVLELPRTSSEDFTTDDLKDVKLLWDVTLEEGDLLYMPRGWIHQACTLKDNNQHSLHLTVSAMQQWAWIDMMEMVIPEAMEAAASSEDSTLLRQGLPRGFTEYMGVMYEETKDDKLPDSLKRVAQEESVENPSKRARIQLQEHFRAEAKKRILKIATTAMEMVDATCDQMAKRFLSERQPPALTAQEKTSTSHNDDTADEKQILPTTRCRLVRPGIGRLVIEEEKAVVYHCADNTREYLGHPLSPLEFEMDDGPALEQLLTTMEPDWILVNDLFHDTIEDKIAVTQALYDEGILAIEQADAV